MQEHQARHLNPVKGQTHCCQFVESGILFEYITTRNSLKWHDNQSRQEDQGPKKHCAQAILQQQALVKHYLNSYQVQSMCHRYKVNHLPKYKWQQWEIGILIQFWVWKKASQRFYSTSHSTQRAKLFPLASMTIKCCFKCHLSFRLRISDKGDKILFR